MTEVAPTPTEAITIEEILEMKAEKLIPEDENEREAITARLDKLIEKMNADRLLFNTQGTSSTRKPKKTKEADKLASGLLLGSTLTLDDLTDG